MSRHSPQSPPDLILLAHENGGAHPRHNSQENSQPIVLYSFTLCLNRASPQKMAPSGMSGGGQSTGRELAPSVWVPLASHWVPRLPVLGHVISVAPGLHIPSSEAQDTSPFLQPQLYLLFVSKINPQKQEQTIKQNKMCKKTSIVSMHSKLSGLWLLSV